MPYINPLNRGYFDEPMFALLQSVQEISPGDLNYIITRIVHAYIGPNVNYTRYNAAVGVLECAKLELYRRQLSALEDEAIARNGDL